MLEIESLYRSCNEVIAPDKSLLVFFVFFIFLSDFIIFELVGVRGKMKGKDSGCFLQQNTDIFLEILDG